MNSKIKDYIKTAIALIIFFGSIIASLYIGGYQMLFKGFLNIINVFGLHITLISIVTILLNIIRICLSGFVGILIIFVLWAIGFCIIDYGN